MQHVVARIPGGDHAVRCDAEGAHDARCHQFGGDREQSDRASRSAVGARDQRADARVVGEPADAQCGRGVQVQALQRDAVPELDDERTARAVAVGVAEAVRHDDDACAQGRPETAGTVAAHRLEALGSRAVEFGIRSGEPDDAVRGAEALPREPRERSRPLAEADARADDPDPVAARHEPRGNGSEPVEREPEQFAGVPGREGEAGHNRHDSGTVSPLGGRGPSGLAR